MRTNSDYNIDFERFKGSLGVSVIRDFISYKFCPFSQLDN